MYMFLCVTEGYKCIKLIITWFVHVNWYFKKKAIRDLFIHLLSYLKQNNDKNIKNVYKLSLRFKPVMCQDPWWYQI